MNIYKLTAIGHVDYDSFDSFVVRAPDEQSARAMCQAVAGDEAGWGTDKAPFWDNPELTTCTVVTAEGQADILCSSFNAG